MKQINTLNQTVNKLCAEVYMLKQKFEDHFLSDKEKILIDETMKEKAEDKLISASEVF